MISKIINLSPDNPSYGGWKLVLDSESHSLYIFPLHCSIVLSDNLHYRRIDFDTGRVDSNWSKVSSSKVNFYPCMVEISSDPTVEAIKSSIRLPLSISNGNAFKIVLSHDNNEIEHSVHVLVSGLIRRHPHHDYQNITEGYRKWNLKTGQPDPWNVVGAGMPETYHDIPYKPGLQVVEGSKRGPGYKSWPELYSKT